MLINYKTRGMSAPQGKPKVYFCCHPEDFEVYFGPISEEILSFQNCAIWYSDADALFNEEYQVELRQMQLFVMPITTKLLTTPNRALDKEFPFATRDFGNHIPVLPILVEGGLDEIFNKKCGDLQFLDRTVHTSAAISYKEKLDKYLSSVLIDDELASKVRAAFDAYIFLSYRKKDRKYIQELMQLIHQNDFCRDVAIWYDEYLTPGEDFNAGITIFLQKSDLFVLVVTPNLLEDGNYVMCYEYPVARNFEKPILPVEMLPTDSEVLKQKYDGIPNSVRTDNRDHFSAALLDSLRHIALRKNDTDLQHNFFIGLAYLGGIDVEVDYGRAVKLITETADAGLPEAMKKLVDMYRTGTGVGRDYRTAICWQERLTAFRRTNYECEKNEINGISLTFALWRLGDFYQELGDISSAKAAYQQMLTSSLEHAQTFATPQCEKRLAVSYDNLGDICQDEGDIAQAKIYYERAYDLLSQLVEKKEAGEIRQDLAINCDDMGSICRAKGELSQARMHYEKAMEFRHQLAEELGTVEARQALSVSYSNLGYIYNAEGDLANAKMYYEKSLKLRHQLAEEDRTAEAQRYLSVSHINIGDINVAEGDPIQAKEHYEKSLELQCQLVEKTGTVEARQDLAVSYERLGSICQTEGELSQAESYYVESFKLRQQLANETGTIDAQRNLSISYNNLGSLYEVKGELFQAKAYYEKDLELGYPLAEQTGTVKDRRGLSTSYNNLGDIYQAEGDLSQAKVYYEKSLELRRQLVAEAEAVWARRDLAISLCSMGIVYRDEGDYSQAQICYNEGLELFHQLVEETGTVEARRDLAIGYSKLGGIYQAGGDLIRARVCCEKSLKVHRQLVDETRASQAYDDLASSYFDIAVVSTEDDSLDMAVQAYKIWKMLHEKYPENSVFLQRLKLVKRYFDI